MALCRLGEACLLEMAPFSRPHTQQRSEAHVWPRIAGIPGQGTSSLPSPFVLACLSINFSIWISSPPSSLSTYQCLFTCTHARARTETHTHTVTTNSQLSGRGELGKGAAHSSPEALLAVCPPFFSVQWTEWPLTALGCKCFVLPCPKKNMEEPPC